MGNFDEPEYGQTPYEDRQALMGEITGSQEDIARIRPGSKVFLLLVFLVPASAGLLFGYDIGGTSNAFLTGFDGHNMQQTFNFSDTVKQAVVSFSLVGAIFGSLCCFGVGDYLSRRGVVMMAGGFYAGGALITGSAVNLGFLLTGRFIYGLGIGFAMHSAPLYIAEIAPPHLRGLLISLKECFIVLGILIGYSAGYCFSPIPYGWRLIYDAAVLPALAVTVGAYLIPPSPRWLALRSMQDSPSYGTNGEPYSAQLELAHEALCQIRQLSRDETQYEFNQVVDSLRQQLKEPFLWREFLDNRVLWRGLIIGCGLVLFQQFTGQPSVLYYAATLFQSAGISAAGAGALATIGVAAVKLVMTGVSTALVDRAGRRPLLIIGISLMLVALGILTCLFIPYTSDTLPKWGSALVIIAMMIYVSGYQVGFGPISWTMISEIFPLHVRSRALSIAVVCNFTANVIVSATYLSLQNLLTIAGAYATYLTVGVVSLVFVFFLVPETKNRSLEEIEELLEGPLILNPLQPWW